MSLLDAIDNYYERLVAEAVEETRSGEDNADFLADVMCVALNRLPSRYYRYSIDMSFYLSDQDMQAMRDKCRAAVKEARGYVKSHQRD